MGDPRPTTYWDYIRVEDLLSLQSGVDGDERALDNEEVLFITVHQVFELWFKLVLRELVAARDLFGRDQVQEQELSQAVHGLKRVTAIFRAAVSHFEVVETLGTREYLEFRDKLMPASGFQSAQMRQIEVLMGLEEDERVPLGAGVSYLDALRDPDGGESPAFRRVAAQLAQGPTLKAAVDAWLLRTPIDGVRHDDPGSQVALDAFIERFLEAHGREVDAACAHALAISPAQDGGRLQQMYAWERDSAVDFFRPDEEQGGAERARIRAAMIFVETYRELPLLAWPREVLASLLEFEQGFLIFRQRHARMVERVIGRRTGTGGSKGVRYLDETALRYRIFRDLWAVRTLMIRPGATPPLERAQYYGFLSAD